MIENQKKSNDTRQTGMIENKKKSNDVRQTGKFLQIIDVYSSIFSSIKPKLDEWLFFDLAEFPWCEQKNVL